MDRRSVYEIGVCSLILVICAVFWIQAARLPPGSFEPLGSGPVPMWTSAIVMLCCVVVIGTALRRLARGPGSDTRVAEPAEPEGTPRTAALLMVLTLAYVAALDVGLASFGAITFVYLATLIWGLEGFGRRFLIPAAVTALIVAFGAEYLFTNVFVVDLPT